MHTSGVCAASCPTPQAARLVILLAAQTVLCTLPVLADGTNARGLPPTTMDSFVTQAAGQAERIYGDEGSVGMSPYEGYETGNRINAGIYGQRDAGLTTGHASYMPDAAGGDEWTGNEWSQSGPTGVSESQRVVEGAAQQILTTIKDHVNEMVEEEIEKARASMANYEFFNWRKHGRGEWFSRGPSDTKR